MKATHLDRSALARFDGALDVDAQRASDPGLAIRELEYLRHVDGVRAPELAAPSEKLVSLFRGEASTSEDLRLPLMRNSDARTVQRALRRLTSTDLTASPGASPGALAAERRMHDVLRGFDSAVSQIRRRAANGSSY